MTSNSLYFSLLSCIFLSDISIVPSCLLHSDNACIFFFISDLLRQMKNVVCIHRIPPTPSTKNKQPPPPPQKNKKKKKNVISYNCIMCRFDL